MRDPAEGLTPEGLITTGVASSHVPSAYDDVLLAAADGLAEALSGGCELHLYGSVATGQAVIGRSDVDLLTIGVPEHVSRQVAAMLTTRFAGLCRSVEIAVAQPEDFAGTGDQVHGNRVFLRHYCLSLRGPDRHRPPEPYRGDAAAARGFNGDLPQHLERWRGLSHDARLGRRLASKTLFAVAGLVSVHDRTWTTDRTTAVRAWGALRPWWRTELAQLLSWAEGAPAAPRAVEEAIAAGGVVEAVVRDLETMVGLWGPRRTLG